MTLKLNQITREHLNQELRLTLLLTSIEIKSARSGKSYADFRVQDQTQKTTLRFWDYQPKNSELELPMIIDCAILVGEYREQLQLTLKKWEPTAQTGITVDQLVRSSRWNPEKMQGWLQDYYEYIEAVHIRELIQRMVFEEPFYEKYCTYPAAKTVHHNFMYGILQHTLEVLKYVKMVAGTKKLTQRQLDRLLAMTFLHDWAKIIEYEPVPSENMTVEGRMLGHIFIGAHHTKKMMDAISNFDETDALIILNGILGHHGAYEWGSPVLPKTVEAQILHQADKLSGDIESILSFTEDQAAREDPFTDKLWNMGTDYFKGGIT
ncbi:HD domain-containing protein [Anoxynatronum sibiricum]|uniref:HD domain-containing protein n=1 Tax=Anoxynatronum sibiricum TaxID=210623 RepID=A0ABU9VPL8_9CLOT